MRTRGRTVTAVVFGSVTFLTTFAWLFQTVPDGQTLFSQLSPSLAYEMLWQPTLLALLLGAASGNVFEKTTRLRSGVLYAALLGLLVAAPTVYLNATRLDELIFNLTSTESYKNAEPLAVGVYNITGHFAVLEPLIWLPGPLTGTLIWTLLRRSHPQKPF